MTPTQRRIVCYALGLPCDFDGTPPVLTAARRNSYTIFRHNRTITEMVDAGWMQLTDEPAELDYDGVFSVTRAGAEAAGVLDRCSDELLGEAVKVAGHG